MLSEVPAVSEGSTCPTCQRRVPHKRKPSSPQTKVISIRVPIDDVETFEEILEAAARHLDLHDKPHWKFWVVHHGLVLSLQSVPKRDLQVVPGQDG
jgi:hypothetical protein